MMRENDEGDGVMYLEDDGRRQVEASAGVDKVRADACKVKARVETVLAGDKIGGCKEVLRRCNERFSVTRCDQI